MNSAYLIKVQFHLTNRSYFLEEHQFPNLNFNVRLFPYGLISRDLFLSVFTWTST